MTDPVAGEAAVHEATVARPRRRTPKEWPTVDDIRQWLRLDSDAVEDGLISAALDAAVAYIESRAGDYIATGGLPTPTGYMATVLEACRLYRRRDSLDGTIGWGDAGVVRVGRFDPDIESMLGPDAVTAT